MIHQSQKYRKNHYLCKNNYIYLAKYINLIKYIINRFYKNSYKLNYTDLNFFIRIAKMTNFDKLKEQFQCFTLTIKGLAIAELMKIFKAIWKIIYNGVIR